LEIKTVVLLRGKICAKTGEEIYQKQWKNGKEIRESRIKPGQSKNGKQVSLFQI
jgi:hypothetical protein